MRQAFMRQTGRSMQDKLGDTSSTAERLIEACTHWRPLRSLWDLEGVTVRELARRTWRSAWVDDLFGSAAELGYWFLFALFPTLVSASSILGLVARHATQNYDAMLHFASLLLPSSAYGFVYQTS